jgi:hypothetical protein
MTVASSSATVCVMSPKDIAPLPGGEKPLFQWPQRASVFAERAMRLRQLAHGPEAGLAGAASFERQLPVLKEALS